MADYFNQYDSDTSETPHNANSSQDEEDIDIDAIENGTYNPAPKQNTSAPPPNTKKRSFNNYNNGNNTTVPTKKQKTAHYTDNEMPIWTCELCTYNNPINSQRCSICTSPKPQTNNTKNKNEDIKENKAETKWNESINSPKGGNISDLISGLKNVRINAQKSDENESGHANGLNNDALDSIIGKLENLQFDATANNAVKSSSKMNDIIHKLSSLEVNKGNINIAHMVRSINDEINKFILEVQQSLYWRFKISNESKKFAAMPYRESIDRIVSILTFYTDHFSDEFKIFEFVNDNTSDFKHLQTDYQRIISDNIIKDKSNNNIVCMHGTFGVYCDYVHQMFPVCPREQCGIFRRYYEGNNGDDGEDMLDDKIGELKGTMDRLHCYMFHTELCGIIVMNDRSLKRIENASKKPKHISLVFGGKWFWFCDDSGVKWVPYTRDDQLRLNNGWRNRQREVMVGVNNKYKVQFKYDCSGVDPYGNQYDCSRRDSLRRAVIYGVSDKDGLLNGIACDKQPM